MDELLSLVVALFFLAFVIAAFTQVEAHTCTVKSVSFEQHRYDIFAGCMVQHEGRWLPLENIRGFN